MEEESIHALTMHVHVMYSVFLERVPPNLYRLACTIKKLPRNAR